MVGDGTNSEGSVEIPYSALLNLLRTEELRDVRHQDFHLK